MPEPVLWVLIADDSADDALLVERFLERTGRKVEMRRACTVNEIEQELRSQAWDVVLSDYSFGPFTAQTVLELANRLEIDVPILIVTGSVGEETAADLMRAGARDFIRKSNLSRLPPAIDREVLDAQTRVDRRRAEHARIAAESDAREARRLQQLVIGSAPIVLYAVDARGVFTLNEGKGLERIGFRNGEIVGRSVVELYGDVPGVLDHMRRVLNGERHEVDVTIKSTAYHLMSVPTRNERGLVIGFAGVALDVTERNRKDEQLRATIDELAQLAEERRALLRHLVTAQERERERIAADLHDDTIQVITAVGLRIAALRRKLAGTPPADLLQPLETEVEGAIKRTRSMLFDLHPRSLESAGLREALDEYLGKLATDAGLEVQLVGALEEEPPQEARTILFRVAQEAVANARKHAHAKKLVVSIKSVKRGVLVRVDDDGVGFDPKTTRSQPGHLGLTAMRERVRLGFGWLRVESAPNEGTSVEFWVPLAAHDHAA